MKTQKFFILVGVSVIILIGFLMWLSGQSPEPETSVLNNNIVLFYGDGCPHCEDVDQFIAENDITSKVSFEHLEVWNNRKNAQIMDNALEICEIDPSTAGVPLLFSQNTCYIGTPKIKVFFRNEAGL